ncbi:MAG: hypothetical protein IKW24_01800, partial [Clostridia bacterium]|nr:hypothetical protein [Clostridia bacterium]
MKKTCKRALALGAAVMLAVTGLASCTPTPPDDPASEINTDWRPNQMNVNLSSDSLYVRRVENMPDDFILGMDASC